MPIIILLVVMFVATFFATSQISLMLADVINFGTPAEIWFFGAVWLCLLFVGLGLAYLAVISIFDYNDNRPRKPLRNR